MEWRNKRLIEQVVGRLFLSLVIDLPASVVTTPSLGCTPESRGVVLGGGPGGWSLLSVTGGTTHEYFTTVGGCTM